ncbi:DUF11 domain-containing protein [Massilia sp. 9096]|uniref:DUF11 domain-containing protein n=1 Tax=Massilia sp. 9096 TaxID=1500894 RepID=UPI00055B32F4|nr:DUF11 domain-containing protein [Massilia sp. 9096]
MQALFRFFLCTCLALLTSVCGAQVVNQASVSFASPAAASPAQRSNIVSALGTQRNTITYFTGFDYTKRAAITAAGQLLYMQAVAPACNANPNELDTIKIDVRSSNSGDIETFTAIETSPDSGVFRVPRNAMPVVTSASNTAATSRSVSSDEDSTKVTSGDGALAAAKNDTLTASIEGCGTGVSTTSILVDPSGVVFDSHTNQPLAGATVTLIDVTGAGNGGHAGGPARVFDVDGVTPAPSTLVTGANGGYVFPLVGPSLYRLQVTAPTNYTYPSKVPASQLAAGRTIHLYGSYGANFPVNEATGAVTLDVPLDPVPGALYLEKSASRANAELGDFVDYTIRVHNAAEQNLQGVIVDDDLPAGFHYQAGTLRLDDAAQADAPGANDSKLHVEVGQLAAGGVRTLRYRVRIGAGALQGDGINRARATSAAPLVLASSVAAAKVKVEAGVFSEKGFIVGRVFADCDGDGDGVKAAQEPGVPGVRIYLEDGSWSITDAEGRYSFAEVRPRTHVAKLDGFTLPAGAMLAITSGRNAGDAGSRFVDLKDGELAKADFALAGCSPRLRADIDARRAQLRAAEQSAKPAAARNKPADANNAGADLAALDNTLGFVDLEDGAILPRAQATIRVKGTVGSTFALIVNGEAVAETRIGRRSKVDARQLESWEFVGVALRPGSNVLEVRQIDQFGNPRGSRRIDVKAPGALKRIRIDLDKTTVPADGKATAMLRVRLEDVNGLAVTERTPLTIDSKLGLWQQTDLDPRTPGLQVFVEGGSADFALRAPVEPGETRIRAASSNVSAETGLSFVPELRPLVAAGVFDGAVSLNRSKGNTSDPVREFDAFEDQLRHVGDQTQVGARAAMFMKGKVGENTLLTAAYDSDKASDGKLFRDLDPNAYYTTYGDDSKRGFDAQSSVRLYLRADRDKSWLLFGDMTPPGATPQRNLGAYTRNLNGLRTHTEFGSLAVDAFASHDSTRQMVEETAANGTSGPYHTGSGTMVVNSERIEILVRDRNQSGMILSRKAQVRYVDYDIEPLTGRILFRAPVPSLDADLNPVTVRISYEVDQGEPAFWVGGAAIQYKIGEHVELGASHVDDRNPALPTTLSSVNATVRAGEKTSVTIEAAQMDKAGAAGRAARIDAVHSDGSLDTRVYAGRADLGFDNPSSSLPRGRVDAGARVRWQALERVGVQGELLHTEDLTTGAARDGVQVSGSYAFGNGVKVEGGVRRAHEVAGANTVLASPDLTSLRAKVSSQIPGLPQAGVYVEAEQDVRDSGRRMAALGGEYRMNNGARLYGRHELISSLGSNYALNEGQQRNATVFGIDADYMKDGRVFSEYRARGAQDGMTGIGASGASGARQAEAAIGLRNLWNIADGVRGSTSFERVQVIAGSNADQAIAVAGAIEYSRDPRWKANARLELRHGADADSVLNTLALAYKLSDSWALLGKNTLSANRSAEGGVNGHSVRGTEWLQTGVAYRGLETIGWNGLAKYELKREQDNGPADFARTVHLVAANANWQPDSATVLSARWAAKAAADRSGGIASRSVAQLVSGHLTRQLGKDWDVGAVAQVLVSAGSRQFGAGLEAGYQLRRNTWVSVGYNLLGFHERDLAGQDATAKGIYARLRIKFDERSLDGLLAADAMK